MHARIAVLAAQHVGDAIARMHTRSLAESASSAREHEWLSARLDQDCRAARHRLRPSLDSEWLATSSLQELVELYEIARIWRARHLEFAQAEVRLLSTLRTRFGLSIGHHSTRNDHEEINCSDQVRSPCPEPRSVQSSG